MKDFRMYYRPFAIAQFVAAIFMIGPVVVLGQGLAAEMSEDRATEHSVHIESSPDREAMAIEIRKVLESQGFKVHRKSPYLDKTLPVEQSEIHTDSDTDFKDVVDIIKTLVGLRVDHIYVDALPDKGDSTRVVVTSRPGTTVKRARDLYQQFKKRFPTVAIDVRISGGVNVTSTRYWGNPADPDYRTPGGQLPSTGAVPVSPVPLIPSAPSVYPNTVDSNPDRIRQELRSTEREIEALANEISRLKDSDMKTKKHDEIRKAVEKAFDLQTRHQKSRMIEFEDRLERLRETIRSRSQRKDAIVEARIRASLSSQVAPESPSAAAGDFGDRSMFESSENDAAKPAPLREFEQYFDVELDLNEEGRVDAVWRLDSVREGFTDRATIRWIEVPQIRMSDLKVTKPQRQIRSVEDIKSLLEDDFPDCISDVTIVVEGARKLRRLSIRRRPDVNLPAPVVTNLSQQRQTLAAKQEADEKSLDQLDGKQFDLRRHQAVQETIPNEIIKLQVQQKAFDTLKRQLKSQYEGEVERQRGRRLKKSDPGKLADLAKIIAHLEEPEIIESEKKRWNTMRQELESSLSGTFPFDLTLDSAMIRAIVGSDSSIPDTSIEDATTAIEQKSKLIAAKIQDLELTLAEADAEYKEASANESKRGNLESEISRLIKLQQTISEWLE